MAKKKKKTKAKARKTAATRAKKPKDVPVTFKALDAVRSELKGDIASLRVEMNAKFKTVDARFDKMDSKMEDIKSMIQRTLALVEEQDSRNKASYEGAEHVLKNYEKLDDRVSSLEEFERSVTTKLKTN